MTEHDKPLSELTEAEPHVLDLQGLWELGPEADRGGMSCISMASTIDPH